MKKLSLLPFILLMVLVVSACNNTNTKVNSEPAKQEDTSATPEKKSGTITYQSENGPIEVPADPSVLSSFLLMQVTSWL